MENMHFPGGTSGKEPTCQCKRRKRLGFNLRVWKIPWRKAWQPSPVFLPGESHGQRSLTGHSPWGCKESDTPEAMKLTRLMNDAALVPGVQQSDSVIHAHASILFQILLPFRLLKSTEQRSPCYTVGPG